LVLSLTAKIQITLDKLNSSSVKSSIDLAQILETDKFLEYVVKMG